MKLKILTLSLATIFFMIILQSASGGRAAVGGQDRTGAPGSLGVCTACHGNNGSFTSPQLSISVKTALGATVTEYTPGETYTLEFSVTSNGSPLGYAMQATVLKSNNTNAGTLLTTTTANTQISTINNGRKFVEHQNRSVTGVFKATWQAPVAGTGNVTIYGLGMAVNANGSTNGDNTSSSTSFLLTESTLNSLNNIENQAKNYELFPIPNNGNFSIKNNGEDGLLLIQLTNLQGQVVYNNQHIATKNSTINLDLDNLVQGVYFVTIQNKNQVETVQMVVSK